MASSIQDIEFLDLTDIDEAERIHLQQVLYTVIPNLELPWGGKNEVPCQPQGFEPPPPFAVAPIPQPSLRAAFVPQPLYTTAPAAVVGVVPSFPGGEPPNGPPMGLISAVESLDCSSGPVVTLDTSSPAGGLIPTHNSGDGEAQFHPDSAPVAMMSVPPSVPSSVTPTSPVITTMYQMVGHAGVPLSNVYVGNVTANVNVHSFVGSPLTPYSPHLPQVFPSGDVPVPTDTAGSPNSSRNGIGPRRPRVNKPGGKRIDAPFGPRTPGVGHGHDVLATTVVDSPPGPPAIPQNYIPVPPMHPHPFQSFYPSPTQPPHGAPHMPQHPSAQHATGAPLFVPLFHPPIYNMYQPGASGPLVFSASPNLVPAPCVTSEQASGIAYTSNEGASERMMPEGRETEMTIPEQQVVFTVEEIHDLKPSGNGGGGEEKILPYRCEDAETESHTPVDVVAGNNESVSEVECKNVNQEVPSVKEQSVDYNVSDSEHLKKSVPPKQETLVDVKTDISSKPVVKAIEVSSGEQVGSSDEKKSTAVSALNLSSKVAKLSSEKAESDVSNGFHFPGTPDTLPSKVKSSVSVSSSYSTPAESSPQTVLNPREKTWASLFDKSGGSSIPSDGAMILATGMSPTSAVKPLAAVRPFQNAVTVTSGSGDSSRKVSDGSLLIGDSSKHFPQLGQSDLPPSPMADDPHLYRLGEFLSKYQLDHKAISLQPRGLTNRSNWCYINSTLQALLACPPFYNLLKSLSLPRKSGKSSTPIIDSMVEFVNEFSLLSPSSRVNRKEKAQRKDDTIEVQVGPAFEPCYIYKMLSNIQSDTFKVEGRQEDAEEFFSCLLNALNDEMLELIKLVKDPSSEGTVSNGDVSNGNSNNLNYESDDTEWKVMGRKNKGSVTRRAEFVRTPVSDIFRGQLRSRVQRAGDHSDNVQPFFTLQLDIEKAQSVKEALDLLGGRDQLEGVTCSKTNQEVEAWQQVTLEELPLVLVLHLKWFNYKLDGCTKIVKTVEFPIDLKVDGKLMSSSNKYSQKQKQYKLFAVVYHDGKEATKGHYITDVYHVGYGGWVRYDDSSVKAIQENQMLHPRGSRVPYLLYYRRCDTIGGLSATPDKR